jgi:transposase
MVKTKTKVSGCFRTKSGAEDYLTIMAYIGTAKKQKINPYEAIRLAIRGTPELIFATGF